MPAHERIVLAGRSGLLRAAHASVLRDAGFDVVAEAGDGGALLRKVRRTARTSRSSTTART